MHEDVDTKINEVLAHFKLNGISHAPGKGLEDVLTFQDAIGHSNLEEIQGYYNTLDEPTKNMFEFACMNCLSSDTSRDIIRHLYIEYIPNSQNIINEFEFEAKLTNRLLSSQINDLKRKVKRLEARNRELENDMRVFAQTMNKYK